MTAAIVKRALSVAIVAGLCLLALFIASEADNIRATSDKSILLVMPGLPLLFGVAALHFLDWQTHFRLSVLLLWLFCLGLLLVAIVETLPLMTFYRFVTSLDPDFSAGFRGEAGRYGLELKTRGLWANITGAVYIFAWAALVAFLAFGALTRARAPAAPVAHPHAPGHAAPHRRVGLAMLAVAIILLLLALAAMWRYVDVAEPPPKVETAPVTSN